MERNTNPTVIYDHLGRQLRQIRHLSSINNPIDVSQIARVLAREEASRNGGFVYIKNPFADNIWIQSIISDIATALSEIPLGLWKPAGRKIARRSTVNWVPLEKHPILDLLDQPNKNQNAMEFIMQLASIYLANGNAWAWKDEDNSYKGVPRALFLLGPDIVRPVRKSTNEMPQAWDVTFPNQETKRWPLNKLIHWRTPNPYDPGMGLPPWWSMRVQIDSDQAKVLYDRYFFRNNATPDAVMTYKPGPLSPASREQIYEAWAEYHAGLENAGGIAVMGGDFDIKVLGVNHSSAQFIDSRKLTREEAATVFHYPVDLLNAQEHGGLGRDRLESARLMKYENAVCPHANYFAAGFTSSLVKPYDRNIAAFFDFENLPVMMSYLKDKIGVAKDLVGIGTPINAAFAKVDIGIDPIEGGDVGLVDKAKIPITVASKFTKADLKPAPKPIPAPGAKPAKPKPAAPKKSNNQIQAEMALVSARLKLSEIHQKKLSKFIHEIRTNAYKFSEPNDPRRKQLMREKWVRWVNPIQLASFCIGVNFANGKLSYDDINKDRLQSSISSMQKSLDKLQPSMLPEELTEFLRNSGKIVDLISISLSRFQGNDWQEHVTNVFSKIESNIESLSDTMIGRSMELGVEHARNLLK